MMIDGEVIVKVENMHVDTPSAAVAEVIKTAGWPLSELLDEKISGILNLDKVLDAGGLGKISPTYIGWRALVFQQQYIYMVSAKNLYIIQAISQDILVLIRLESI